MSVQVKRRRDTGANVAAYAGAQGELIVDTTNNRVTVHDGATAGGFAAAKLSEVVTNARTAVNDAPYSVLATDGTIAYTALSAARVVGLPAASAFPTGRALTIVDESGGCSPLNVLNVTPNGSDKIDGVNAAVSVNAPYGFITLQSNGLAGPNGKWTIIDEPVGMIATQPLTLGANGAGMTFKTIEQSVTLSGSSTTASVPIPANCIVYGVSTRVTTAVTGAPSFGVGVSGNATLFGGALSVTVGATNYGLIGPAPYYASTNLIVTPTSGSFTGGVLRLAIHCLVLAPPQS